MPAPFRAMLSVVFTVVGSQADVWKMREVVFPEYAILQL
jgi:hypothetical protein